MMTKSLKKVVSIYSLVLKRASFSTFPRMRTMMKGKEERVWNRILTTKVIVYHEL